jgi:hypothetical protein
MSDGKARYSLFGVYHAPTVNRNRGRSTCMAPSSLRLPCQVCNDRFTDRLSSTDMSLPPVLESTGEHDLTAQTSGVILDALSTKKAVPSSSRSMSLAYPTAIADLTVSAYIESGSTTAGLAGPAGPERRRSIAWELTSESANSSSRNFCKIWRYAYSAQERISRATSCYKTSGLGLCPCSTEVPDTRSSCAPRHCQSRIPSGPLGILPGHRNCQTSAAESDGHSDPALAPELRQVRAARV